MNLVRHLESEDLDRLSMGMASEAETAALEEHLLVCETCRARVEENDQYVAAMQAAASRLRALPETETSQVRIPRFRLIYAGAFASILLAAIVLVRYADFGTPSAPLPVTLRAMRGSLPGAQTKAGLRLALAPDTTGLPSFPSYQLEVVDAIGRRMVRTDFKGDPVTIARLSPGMYFVRLYSPAGELLREYGLETLTQRRRDAE